MVHGIDSIGRYLEQNNAFYNYQFGFRNHSTNHALIEITEQI